MPKFFRTLTTIKPRKKYLRTALLTVAAGMLLYLGFNVLMNYMAKRIVEDLVERRSGGKLKMQTDRFRFSWFSRKVELKNTVIYTVDSAGATTAYRFSIRHIRLAVQEILPILFDKKLLIDSLSLSDPVIRVTRLKPVNRPEIKEDRDFSIPEEMGKIYRSIREALQTLQVKKFRIDGARFTLVNKVRPGQLPLEIGNIRFQLDNLSVDADTSASASHLFFSDNLHLQSHQQDIIFPDGKHRLAFRHFRINLQQQLVEFDSCTISTEQTGDTRSRFRVFLDTLRLARIDFDTLYRSEVIRADSVYCLNPRFELEVEKKERPKETKKTVQQLESIVQQLTGDLLVDHVVVRNADFHIRTRVEKRNASFDFTQNNFELQGLRVARNDPKPLTVQSVDLAIRNYENFIRDSSYRLSFDSVRIREDQVILDHFVLEMPGAGKKGSRFSIPRFTLRGLSWDDLVFDQQLSAREATLFQPVIRYNTVQAGPAAKGKQSIFTTLGNIGRIIHLDRMLIEKGKIDISLRNNNTVQLEDASMTVRMQTLFKAKKARAIEPAVDYLDFRKGAVRAGNLEIGLEEVVYYGQENGFLLARKATVEDREKEISLMAENAAVDDVLTDEESGDLSATGIRWDKASIRIQLPDQKAEPSGRQPVFELRDLAGRQTDIAITGRGKTYQTFVDSVSFRVFLLENGKPLLLQDGYITGRDLLYKESGRTLRAAHYRVQDGQASVINGLHYNTAGEKGGMNLTVPLLRFQPDISSLLDGSLRSGLLYAERPVLSVETNPGGKLNLPPLFIDSITLIQPLLRYTQKAADGTRCLQWLGHQKEGNQLRLYQVNNRTGENPVFETRKAFLQLNHFSYDLPGGKNFDTGEGTVIAELQDIQLKPETTEAAEWSVRISRLLASGFSAERPGNKKGRLQIDSLLLEDFPLESQTLLKPFQLLATKGDWKMSGLTGSYTDSLQKLRWSNAGFERASGIFSLDSVLYEPASSADEIKKNLSYQKDYIRTGAASIRMGPVDAETFARDTLLHTRMLRVSSAWLEDAKDKRLPFAAGTIKPLPVTLLRKIPFRFIADSAFLSDARVLYTETNEKGLSAQVPVKSLNLVISNLRNTGIKETDSLDIRASGTVLDSIRIILRVLQSYTDPLEGFRMGAKIHIADLQVLNPVLIPLTSARLVSGGADTLYLQVTGREFLAMGALQIKYNNLKVRFLYEGRENKLPLRIRLRNFMANSFVIRRKSRSRDSDIFLIRKRDRSAINYLLRIVLSGVSSSVGAVSHRKQMRLYSRELQEKGLPPPGFED
ncbi:MAG: hypothetical protein IAE96_00435 [Chitinophagaceae bacterium]|nr:hypothetical protein [Chitinophagaceae bacterium]